MTRKEICCSLIVQLPRNFFLQQHHLLFLKKGKYAKKSFLELIVPVELKDLI